MTDAAPAGRGLRIIPREADASFPYDGSVRENGCVPRSYFPRFYLLLSHHFFYHLSFAAPPRRSPAALIVAAAVLIGLMVAGPLRPAPAQADDATLSAWTGGELPSFTLDDLRGEPHDLRQQEGRVVLVHFFATWCEPCIGELTSLQKLAHASRDKPLGIVAVDVAEVDLRVRAFFEKLPVDFPVLLDRDRAVTKAWGVSALPTTIVLDATLTPRLIVAGDLDWMRPETVSAIEKFYPKPQENTERQSTP